MRLSQDYTVGRRTLGGYHISLQRSLQLIIASSFIAILLLAISSWSNQHSSHLTGVSTLALGKFWPGATAPVGTEIYGWHTVSSFNPVQQTTANKSMNELCGAFPRNALRNIQPVLKTGSGLLETRLVPHLQSVSACMGDELLIFSDTAQEVDGHTIVDALSALRTEFVSGNSQLESYIAREKLADNMTAPPESGADSANTKGWQTDKFKFLPQVSYTWRMRPEKRWYVFYEDDTYIVWDNMIRFLDNFDPDLPWYFGSPSPGARGLWMANGGPGYVISREAMRRLVKEDYDDDGTYKGSMLSQRWEKEIMEDCCGDSILGLALHQDARTNLSGMFPMFQPHGLHSIPLSDEYWCQPLITMHKTSTEHMMTFRRWEESRRRLRQPLLFADVVDFLNLTKTSLREGWINSDFDGYAASDDGAHSSHTACALACEKDPNCLQWTYHDDTCEFAASIRLGHSLPLKEESPGSKEGEAARSSHDDNRSLAGWDLNGIKRWMSKDGRDCKHVRWEKPSTSRIY